MLDEDITTPSEHSDVRSEDTAHQKRSIFEEPDDDADLVLCTTDKARLFAHKVILQHTSPIFATLFSLPQPKETGSPCQPRMDTAGPDGSDGLPTVAVTETKAVWDIILRLLYHRGTPRFTTPFEMRPILEAARKYELECITVIIAHILSCPTRRTSSWDSVEVYALASLYGLSDVAQQAARATLTTPMPELYTKELYDVPAYVLQRLLDFRWRCQEAARGVTGFSRATTGGQAQLGRLFKRIDWLPRADFTFFKCRCNTAAVSCSILVGAEFVMFTARAYWKEYMERAEQVVRERPVGAAIKDPALIIPALRAADNCIDCRQHIYLDMMAFTEHLERAIDNATSKVPLKT